MSETPSFQDETASELKNSESVAADGVDAGTEAEIELALTPWQAEFKTALSVLEGKIRNHLAAAARLAEKADDLEGVDQDISRERVLQDEAAERQAAETLKLERVALIEGVPHEHLRESETIRRELGITLTAN